MAKQKIDYLFGTFSGVDKDGSVVSLTVDKNTKDSDVAKFLESNKELKDFMTDKDRVRKQRDLMK